MDVFKIIGAAITIAGAVFVMGLAIMTIAEAEVSAWVSALAMLI